MSISYTWEAKDVITLLLAGASFLLSLYTLWVTQLWRGQLKMTQPTLLCFMREKPSGRLKIFLRTLLYSTATRGRVVQSIFLKVHQSHGGTYIFDFWGHTETGKLTLGSGLFVGPNGVACDHHFNLRDGSENFLFVDGKYRVEVFAAVVGRLKAEKLMEITFALDSQKAAELIQITSRELFLFWNADTLTYDMRLGEPPAPGVIVMEGRL